MRTLERSHSSSRTIRRMERGYRLSKNTFEIILRRFQSSVAIRNLQLHSAFHKTPLLFSCARKRRATSNLQRHELAVISIGSDSKTKELKTGGPRMIFIRNFGRRTHLSASIPCAVILLMSATASLSQSADRLHTFFKQNIGLSDSEIAAIDQGKPVAKVLESPTP